MEEALAVWAMAMITGVAVWALRALNRHWDRKHQRAMAGREAGELADRVTELERRIDAAAVVEERLIELEERQDFAERLLTQSARGALGAEEP